MIIEASQQSSKGHLYCDDCGTIWCTHIERFVRDYEDAEVLWSHHPNHLSIEVPIIPTSNIWGKVILVAIESREAYMATLAYRQDPVVSADLGVIYPGEARLTLREMIMAWFIGFHQKDMEDRGCTAAGHGYHETVRWNTDMKHETKRLRQHWTLFMTGKCLGCTFDASNVDAFVPADKSTSPWNPGG